MPDPFTDEDRARFKAMIHAGGRIDSGDARSLIRALAHIDHLEKAQSNQRDRATLIAEERDQLQARANDLEKALRRIEAETAAGAASGGMSEWLYGCEFARDAARAALKGEENG